MDVLRKLSLSVLAVLLFSFPAAALDSVEDAFCVCVDGVLGTGDYVSCLSKMTRRLVAAEVITQAERSELIAAAAETDLEALQDLCDAQSSGGGTLWGFGTSFSVRNAFCPSTSPTGPLCGILGKLRLWNNSWDDIWLVARQGGAPEGCLFEVTVEDEQDRIVRTIPVVCLDVITEYELPIGTVMEYDLVVPMAAENSDPSTGLVNTEPLPDGIYQIRIHWLLSGPENRSGTWSTLGEFPEVIVPVRVGGSPS
jgi:hypothetical protein